MEVRIDDEGPIRVVRLSNPPRRNALTRGMLEELADALPRAPSSADQPIRAVVLAGDEAGRAFSSGFDLTAIDDDERGRGLDPIRAPADALEACPVPVFAALEGPVMGGGLEIAMACHVRVAARGATLRMPPARLGLVYSAFGLQRFLRATAPSRVQRMFLTGDSVDVDEALAWGLVDAVVEEGRALERALALAGRVAGNAPLAVAGLLDAIRRLSRPGGPTAADLLAIEEARARTVASEDLQEGVRAFAEKRAPVFRGR